MTAKPSINQKGTLCIVSDPAVEEKFDQYPSTVRKKMLHLRKMILSVAHEAEGITDLQETLKWNEPSYLSKRGSTIRIDWKAKTPDQYAMYFKCTSKLVPTFRKKFGDLFLYEGNRAIIFALDDNIPEAELKKCITAGLTYHQVKHLTDLGIE